MAQKTQELRSLWMRRLAAAVLPRVLWALCVVLVALAVVFVRDTPLVPARGGRPNLDVLVVVPFLAYAAVGAFVASRRHKNAVCCGPWCGWQLGASYLNGCSKAVPLLSRPTAIPLPRDLDLGEQLRQANG